MFSGYSETGLSGANYVQHEPEKDDLDLEHIYVLDPADKILDVVDNSYLGKIHSVNKKTRLLKRAIRPTKEYILYKRRNKDRLD